MTLHLHFAQAALGKDKKKNQVAAGEAIAQEPVVSQAADPAEVKTHLCQKVGPYEGALLNYTFSKF